MPKTINGLTVTTSAAADDLLAIWRAANGDTRKITKANFMGGVLTGGGTLATGGFALTVGATSIINGSLVGNISGGGTLATGGFTGTLPATGTFSLLGTAQTYSALKTFSAGLTFGGNTLNNYTITTWTPAQAGVTLSTAVGNYVRIGNLVLASAYCVWPATADTTSINITGAPGTPVGAFQNGGSITRTDYGSAFCISMQPSPTRVSFRSLADVPITNANFSGKFIFFQALYEIS